MNLAHQFSLCQELASQIVAAYREQAPAGFDPQNTWVAAGVAVVGVGVSAYSASQASKAGSAARNASAELGGLPYEMQREQAGAYADAQMNLQQRYAQMVLGMNPAFQQQQIANQKASAKAALELYPQFAAAERKATSKVRGGDLGDLNKYGAGYIGAFNELSPGFAAVTNEVQNGGKMDPLSQQLNLQAMFGNERSALGRELERTALQGLRLGQSLSPEEERNAQQSARGAWASRGLGMSNGAVGSEILQRDAFARQRENERRQYGMGVEGLLFNEDEANKRFGLNVSGQNMGRQQQRNNFLLGASEVTSKPLYGMLSTRTPDMFGSVLGAMGLGMPVGMPGQVAQGAPSIYQGAQALTPLYNYGADVANTNFNAGESRQIRSANAWGSIGSGLTSAGGSLASAQISAGG